MNSCESEKKRMEWIREESREDLKIEAALTGFVKVKKGSSEEGGKAKKKKVSMGETKEKERKCPNCKISKEKSIGLDTLVYVYEGSSMPQFYCRECGFVNPPADWIRQRRISEITLVRGKVKEKSSKQLSRKYSRFFY